VSGNVALSPKEDGKGIKMRTITMWAGSHRRSHATARWMCSVTAVLLGGAVICPSLAQGQTYYWDSNGATAGFGTATGTWAAPTTGNSAQGWSTSATGELLPGNVTTLTTNALNFGNGATGLGAGTISVSGTVSSGNMTFASGSGGIVLSGGTINVAAATTLFVDNTAANTISSQITGASTSLTKNGTGTLLLSGSNSFTGGVTINAGTLRISNSNSLGTGTKTITMQGTSRRLELTGDITVGSNITMTMSSNSGDGLGLSSISGNNTIQGKINVSFGNPALNISSSAGSTLTINGNIELVTSGRPLLFGGASTSLNTVTGNISQNLPGNVLSVTKQGAGTWVFAGTNTYTGTTTITGGTLQIGNGGGTGVLNTASAITNNATLAFNRTGTVTQGTDFGSISGTGLVAQNGSGTLVLGTGSTYTGGTQVTVGTLQLASGATVLGSANGTLTVNGGLVDMNNNSLTVGNLTGTGGTIQGSSGTRTLTIGSGDFGGGNFQGVITDGSGGTTALTKVGTGTMTLSGSNTYTGATTISAGTLAVNGTIASSSLAVNGRLGGSGVLTNATLSGAGSIDPGNSPGVLTAAATDPTGGLDYNFELTTANVLPAWSSANASINDVLRLTNGTTPFTGNLTAANVVNVYLGSGNATLTVGDVFTGGFYTDRNADFLSTISGATFNYFLADEAGDVDYNGIKFFAYSGPNTITVATANQTANFGAGDVNGYVTTFTVVPEPTTMVLLGAGVAILGFRLVRRRNA
jgi:autotransporter-associated beta strand protein